MKTYRITDDANTRIGRTVTGKIEISANYFGHEVKTLKDPTGAVTFAQYDDQNGWISNLPEFSLFVTVAAV